MTCFLGTFNGQICDPPQLQHQAGTRVQVSKCILRGREEGSLVPVDNAAGGAAGWCVGSKF